MTEYEFLRETKGFLEQNVRLSKERQVRLEERLETVNEMLEKYCRTESEETVLGDLV